MNNNFFLLLWFLRCCGFTIYFTDLIFILKKEQYNRGFINVLMDFIPKKYNLNSFVKKFLILLEIIIFADYNFNVVNY